MTLNFDEFRKRCEELDLVRCARCGKMIPAIETRCPECGVNFMGEAGDFTHPSERSARRRYSFWVAIVAVVLIISLIVASLGLW